MADIQLYSFRPSSCCWRLRLALLLKGLAFETKEVDLRKGEQFSDEFRALNPLSHVPVLVVDGKAICDSNVCLEYLEERFPHHRPLLPKDLISRAAVRNAVAIIVSYVQPMQNARLMKELLDEQGEEAALLWAQRYIGKGFEALERIVVTTAGKYCFGDEITLADVVLLPQVYNSRLYNIKMGMYPTLQRISDDLFLLPEVTATAP